MKISELILSILSEKSRLNKNALNIIDKFDRLIKNIIRMHSLMNYELRNRNYSTVLLR